jgi:hypothetical protein
VSSSPTRQRPLIVSALKKGTAPALNKVNRERASARNRATGTPLRFAVGKPGSHLGRDRIMLLLWDAILMYRAFGIHTFSEREHSAGHEVCFQHSCSAASLAFSVHFERSDPSHRKISPPIGSPRPIALYSPPHCESRLNRRFHLLSLPTRVTNRHAQEAQKGNHHE